MTSDLARILVAAAQSIALDNKNIIFYGSSSGGFASLALAHKIPGSSAIAINPQIDVLKLFVKSKLAAFKNYLFNGLSDEDLSSQYGDRLNLKQLYKGGENNRILIVSNVTDTDHHEIHFLDFWRHLGGSTPHLGMNFHGKMMAYIYSMPGGHNARDNEEMCKFYIQALEHGASNLPVIKILAGRQDLYFGVRNASDDKKKILKAILSHIRPKALMSTNLAPTLHEQHAFLAEPKENRAKSKKSAASQYLHDGFMHSLFPFYDICFIGGKVENLRNNVAEIAEKIALPIRTRGSFIYIGNAPDLGIYLSGWGKIAGQMFYGDIDESIKPADALYGTGNYTFFKVFKHSVFACHELFGMGSIYYYEDENIHILSNRPHLAAIFSLFAKQRQLNIPYIKSYILNSSFFRDQLGLDHSPLQNLLRVPTTKYAVLYSDGIKLFPRKEPESDLDYDTLLENGIEECRSDLALLKQKIPGCTFVFDLTGGKDSRANLAPFIDSEQLIHTKPDDADDVLISNTIVSFFPNLRYNKQYQGNLQYITYNDALQVWRSYSFGYFHRIAIRSNANFGISSQINISGAYEIFRTYFIWNKPTEECDIVLWFKFLMSSPKSNLFLSFLDPEDQQIVTDYISEYIRNNFSDYTEEDLAMTNFYYYGRWRTHFGHQLLAIFYNNLNIHPLLNKNIYILIRKTKFTNRKTSKILYDIVYKKSKLLAFINYNSSKNSYSFPYQEHLRTFVPSPNPEKLNIINKQYEEAMATIEKQKQELLTVMPGNKTQSLHDILNFEVAKAISRIIRSYPELKNYLLKLYYSFNYEHPITTKNCIASKILSVDDYLFPLNSLKHNQDDIKYLYEVVMPIKSIIVDENKITLDLFDYIDISYFEFGLYLHNKDQITKFSYQKSPIFVKDQKNIDIITVFYKNKVSKEARYIQKKYSAPIT